LEAGKDTKMVLDSIIANINRASLLASLVLGLQESLKILTIEILLSVKKGGNCTLKYQNRLTMKNFTRILAVGALAVPFMGSAQVNTSPENRNAVVEEWTGIHCGYCPTGHAAVQSAYTNNPGDVVAINFHSGGYAVPNAGEPDYRTPEGTIHDGAFSISGYPSSTLNRRTIGGSQTYHPAGTNDADKVPAVLAETSEVNMYMTATLDIVTRQLDVDVEYYYTSNAPNSTNYMNVAILQNNVQGPQVTYGSGNYNPGGWINYPTVYNHQHMFRGFMTGQWGAAINSTTAGSTATMSYSQVLPMDINGVPLNIAEIEIAAYIGDGVQSAGDILTGVSVKPTLTGFTSTDEVVFAAANLDDILSCAVGAQTMSPTTDLQNWGSNTMTSATITYDVNGGTPSVMNWTGSIAPGATQTITLDPITFTPNAGSNTLNVTASNPNGVADNTADNAGSSTFNVTLATLSNSIDVTLNLVTDRYGSETTWDVKNSGGATVYSGGPYGPDLTANGTTTQPAVPMTLAIDECYTFTIYDSYGDGIDSGYGVGSFEIVDDQSTVLVSGGDFAAEDQGLFKTPLAGLKDLGLEDVSVYPNPASDVLNVDFTAEGSDYTVAIMDLQGRVLATQTGTNVSFQVAEFAAGSYIVTISTDAGVYTENVVIK
jgi:hypothetical protein